MNNSFFKTGLVRNWTDEELDNAIVSYTSKDPIFNFHISPRGKEILDLAARRHGLTMSTFMRLALLETLQRIYTADSTK